MTVEQIVSFSRRRVVTHEDPGCRGHATDQAPWNGPTHGSVLGMREELRPKSLHSDRHVCLLPIYWLENGGSSPRNQCLLPIPLPLEPRRRPQRHLHLRQIRLSYLQGRQAKRYLASGEKGGCNPSRQQDEGWGRSSGATQGSKLRLGRHTENLQGV